jgi:carbamoyltransferase
LLLCGLKLTHDAGLALIDDGVLVASVEVEKLQNRIRHAAMPDLGLVGEALAAYGLGSMPLG